jgi:hypothetical protein
MDAEKKRKAKSGKAGTDIPNRQWCQKVVTRQMSHDFGGFRDGQAKRNTPMAPHKMMGRKNRQLRSLFISTTVHVAVVAPLPDDPLPTTRECKKNTRATMNAKAEMQAINNPSRRRVEMLITSCCVTPPEPSRTSSFGQPASSR